MGYLTTLMGLVMIYNAKDERSLAVGTVMAGFGTNMVLRDTAKEK